MIDWNKPIEVYENREWRSAEFVAEDATDVCFRLNGELRLWNKDEDDIRNTPPAPCEHDGKTYGICSKCGKHVSTHAPAPDSVEAAKAVLPTLAKKASFYSHEIEYESEWRTLLDGIRYFLTAYISEQTAQRKAAGKLAEAAREFASFSSTTRSEPVFAALAADAEARAGKDGGK